MNRAFIVGAILLAGMAGPACRRVAEADSPAGREMEARSYLQTISLRTLVENAAAQNRTSWPAERRETLRSFIRSETRWSELEKAISSALIENFSAQEIRALAGFQGSPEGRSILAKLPLYQAKVLPVLQAEIQRVLDSADLSLSALRWEAPIRELTAGPADETVAADFSFRNSGARPVGLRTLATTCGCTTAAIEKTLFQPGESGSIRVLFAKGNRVGIQNEQIIVTTDETGVPALTLRLRVMIQDPVKIAPRFLFWKSGAPPSAQALSLDAAAGGDLALVGLDSVSPGFTAETTVTADKSAIRAEIAPRTTQRPLSGKVVFLAAGNGGRVIRIPVYLRVLAAESGIGPKAAEGGRILWIDAQPNTAGDTSRFPGALALSEDSWDSQIEPILARWTPETRIVVFGQPADTAGRIAQRLKTFGLGLVFVLAPIQ